MFLLNDVISERFNLKNLNSDLELHVLIFLIKEKKNNIMLNIEKMFFLLNKHYMIVYHLTSKMIYKMHIFLEYYWTVT